MGLRPGRTMRKLERPYTRISYRNPRKGYVKGVPQPKIRMFEMGNKEGNFDTALYLIAKESGQIRHNALEAARVTANKFLEKKLGSSNYFLKILVYPHQVIREKPIAMGAGADRYSQGMRLAFGKPVGTAARVFVNHRIMVVKTNKQNVEIAKQALKKAASKISVPCRIVTEEIG